MLGLWFATACGAGSDAPVTESDKRARLDTMVEQVREDFPDVEHISASELTRLVDQEDIVLVDVRTDAERAVSRIPGSISESEFLENLSSFADRPIAAYCTVGVRSAEFARQMAEQGIAVSNVEGSILAWTHSGGVLVNDDGETQTLHVYGERWDLAADAYPTVW